MAEAILRHAARGRITVESAGTAPQLEIHPTAREAVKHLFDLEMPGQYPKNVDRFRDEAFDYVITVCDQAAESCPVFPGGGERIHWSFADPAAAEGTRAEKREAFEQTANALLVRIQQWLSQPSVQDRLADSS